jgi:hypothetical protein
MRTVPVLRGRERDVPCCRAPAQLWAQSAMPGESTASLASIQRSRGRTRSSSSSPPRSRISAVREMLRSRGRSAGSRVDQGIFCPGTWLASMTARARRVSSWTREFQPRASPSREAMARAWPRAGLLTDAAVQCREWNRRDWPGADSSSCSQRGSGGPAGTGPASGCGSRGRRFILATPANDSWCQRTAAKSAGPRSGALLAVPAAWRAACSQQLRQWPFFSGRGRRQIPHGPGSCRRAKS